jgi:hypothetical protein
MDITSSSSNTIRVSGFGPVSMSHGPGPCPVRSGDRKVEKYKTKWKLKKKEKKKDLDQTPSNAGPSVDSV